MARRVFFSFHYEDVKTFRVNVVRNHSVTKGVEEAGFFDSSIWEDAELHGDVAVKNLINKSLENTSVTCVLIGSDTWNRKWVKYEILKSYEKGNKLIGIHINKIPDKYKHTFLNGANPFEFIGFYVDSTGNVNKYQEHNGLNWITFQELKPTLNNFNIKYRNRGYKFSSWVPVYDWVEDNGYINFPNWIL